MEEQVKHQKLKLFGRILFYILALAVFVFLLGLSLNKQIGFVDENDNFVGGMVVARGGLLYKDFISQHMPLMYYICAAFSALGAQTNMQFRLYFYVFYAVLWIIFLIRYGRKFNLFGVFLAISFYLISFTEMFSWCVVSEQLQAYGMAILLLEFWLFVQTREIKISNCIFISLAIFVSFGTAFMALYAIFVIAVGVLGIEIRYMIKNHMPFKKCVTYFIGKYWKLVLIVAAPFLVLIGYYVATGTLDDFIYGAVTLNLKYYINYPQLDSSSALGNFVHIVVKYFKLLIECFTYFGTRPEHYIGTLICALSALTGCVVLARKNIFAAVITFYFVLMCGIRGMDLQFHALPYTCMGMFLVAYLVAQLWNTVWQKRKVFRFAASLAGVGMAGLLIMVYCSTAESPLYILEHPETESNLPTQEGTMPFYINKLTDSDAHVMLTSTETFYLVQTQRLPVPVGCSTPWTYAAYKDQEIETIKKYDPELILLEEEKEVLGEKLKEYAPEVCEYVKKNYHHLLFGDIHEIYLSEEAYRRDADQGFFDTDTTASFGERTDLLELYETVNQTFVAESDEISRIRLTFGTNGRVNHSYIGVALYDKASGALLYQSQIDASEIEDNETVVLVPDAVSVTPGQEYVLSLTPINADQKNRVVLYCADTDSVCNFTYRLKGSLEGLQAYYDFNLALKVDYTGKIGQVTASADQAAADSSAEAQPSTDPASEQPAADPASEQPATDPAAEQPAENSQETVPDTAEQEQPSEDGQQTAA